MLLKKVLLSFTVLIGLSCSSVQEKTDDNIVSTEINAENLVVADYSIEGMVCAMGCAATIQKDVVEMDGVAVSNVDFESGKAHFEYDKAIVTEKEIIAKIENLADGIYKVTKLDNEDIDGAVEDVNDKNSSGEIEVSMPNFKIPNLFKLLFNQV